MTKPDMLAEMAEAPDAVARLVERQGSALKAVAALIKRRSPALLTTAARGSSDHAAAFFKYLIEMEVGLPVASLGPSVASVYDRPLRLDRALHLTISQSGASPDLVAVQAAAKAGGAATVAIVNVAESPLASEADLVVNIEAGPEHSVAATKSFIASAAALASLAGQLSGTGLAKAVERLPQALLDLDPAPVADSVAALSDVPGLYALGRGPSLGLANEAALKFKEIAGLHAEPFSLAEVMHGPLSLVGPGFPIVGFFADDGALPHHREALDRISGLGADLHIFTSEELPGRRLPMARTGHSAIDALSSMGSFYRLAHAVALVRGLDPEKPRNLAKVTRTA